MPDEEIREIMDEYDLEEDEAEKINDIVNNEGLDIEDAIELQELFD